MKLRLPTTIDRAAVSQEWREIVGPEKGAPDTAVRRVQIMVPENPEIYLSHHNDTDKLYGVNRTYKGPPCRPNATVEISILAGQALYAATKIGNATMTIICEYVE